MELIKKPCSKCHRKLHLDYFYANRSRAGGKDEYCKECRCARNSAIRLDRLPRPCANPDCTATIIPVTAVHRYCCPHCQRVGPTNERRIARAQERVLAFEAEQPDRALRHNDLFPPLDPVISEVGAIPYLHPHQIQIIRAAGLDGDAGIVF